MTNKLICFFIFNAILFFTKAQNKTQDYAESLKKITDVMVYDVTSPVAASRNYAYICLVANEIYNLNPNKTPHHLSKKINNFPIYKRTILSTDSVNFNLAVIISMYKTAALLLPSQERLHNILDSLKNKYVIAGKSQEFFASQNLVDSFLSYFMQFIKADGFQQLSKYPRYTPHYGAGYWKPTPPAYMAAIEPYWWQLRPFFINNLKHIKTKPPAPYSNDKKSPFYQLCNEVFEVVNSKDTFKQNIADFWDCNPYKMNQMGHVEFGTKKITPGAHWLHITTILCLQQNLELSQMIYIHAIVALTLADAFIATWYEKYLTNRVRPETAIRALMDPHWKPYLQSPPFPEYVSGHSVISHAAAIVLQHVFGDTIGFYDNSETDYGLPIKYFSSIRAAANEAAISRLYGGIHFKDAIENGRVLGQKISKKILKKINF